MQYYAPDFELNVRSSNMENSNSREYLEKITAAVIDNLRQTGPVPSVQMQDVPRRPFGGMTDEEEAELDDLDEDENKDVRMTEHRWDKQVQNDAEFEQSDDEDMSGANGATRRNGSKRNFNDYRKGAMDVDSGKESSANGANGAASGDLTVDDAAEANDDTIEDIVATEKEEEQPAQDKEAHKESEKEKVDGDGDVGMAESANPEESTKIKQEEAEAETAEATSSAKAAAEKETDETTTKDAAEEAPSEVKLAESTVEKPTEGAGEKSGDEPAVDPMDLDEEKGKEPEPTEKAVES